MLLIGTTTFRRFDPGLPNLSKALPEDLDWVVAPDGEQAHRWCAKHCKSFGFLPIGNGKRRGVAGNKNRIISYFLRHPEYEHLFLFEDDTFPIKDGWIELYRDAHRESESECLLYLPKGQYGKVVWEHASGKVHGLERNGGCLFSLTRRAVETCGGFHPAFRIYGGEDSELPRRLTRNGLMPYTRLSPVGAEEFIDGWDRMNFEGRLEEGAMAPWTDDVEKIPDSALRRHAKEGLEIYERVKDDGSKFHDPGDWRK